MQPGRGSVISTPSWHGRSRRLASRRSTSSMRCRRSSVAALRLQLSGSRQDDVALRDGTSFTVSLDTATTVDEAIALIDAAAGAAGVEGVSRRA